MTVLSVIRDACPFLGLAQPTAVYSSAEQTEIELAIIANEMAQRISDAFDWNLLKRRTTYTGNGETDAYPLPSDYDRMPVKQSVFTGSYPTPMAYVSSHDEWLDMVVRDNTYLTNAFTLLGGEIVFMPVLGSGTTATLYYMSNLRATDAALVTKTAFTDDTDLFRLDPTLLRLGIIWQWKAYKGLPYGEDLQTYELRLGDRIRNDGGSRHIAIGRPRWPRGVEIAYPGIIEG